MDGFLFDSINGDRAYGSQDVANAFHDVISNGVAKIESDFQITQLSGTKVRIGPGSAWIGGRHFRHSGYTDVDVPTYGNEIVTPLQKDSSLVLACYTESEKRGFEFVCKNNYPGQGSLAQNEILIADYACRRDPYFGSTQYIWRRVVAADPKNAIRNYQIVPYTDSNGFGSQIAVDLPSGLSYCTGNITITKYTNFTSGSGGIYYGNIGFACARWFKTTSILTASATGMYLDRMVNASYYDYINSSSYLSFELYMKNITTGNTSIMFSILGETR